MAEANVTIDGGESGAAPEAPRGMTDIEVAEFLAGFRDRPQEDQEASPVYQELISFPGWGAGAQYRDSEAPAPEAPEAPSLEPPPDPRLPALERREAAGEQPESTPTQVTQNPDASRSITTADRNAESNPWADYNPPPEDGSGAWMPVNTDVRPPYPGDWQRRQGGWYRTPTE